MLYDLFLKKLDVQLLNFFSVRIFFSFFFTFFANIVLLSKASHLLPGDRGKLLSIDGEKSKGKPTGSGIIFLSIFLVSVFFFNSINLDLYLSAILIFSSMLFGFFDDKSEKEWGEYKKAVFDLILSSLGALILIKWGEINIWIPFFKDFFIDSPVIQFVIYTAVLWISINTTNCSDGVDGLSGILVLVCISSLSILLYFVLGNVNIAGYLLVPFIKDGASWAVMSFSLIGSIFAYLWYNAYPSKILMGDAGSRGLGFAIGIIILKTGNPFLYFMVSTVLFINGGTGLIKVSLKRFFNIHIFKNIRFPLHDHMKENYKWSSTQIMVKFLILQLIIIFAFVILLFKIR